MQTLVTVLILLTLFVCYAISARRLPLVALLVWALLAGAAVVVFALVS